MTTGFTARVDNIRNTLIAISKRRTFRYGVPFILFVVGGSFGLREWTQIRYQFSQVKGVSKEEAEKMGLHREKTVSLDTAYEEIQKLDIDNWENKRGPRPWEINESKKLN
ncbi:cytochrome c oxidase assembly protein COX16 homolog, mitochondrial [Bombyx mandarina]|uniref:Cytochrome c oxidase assembly protein COX16 homolog, mitochondrial n=1 Tax=Bombyx mandarina TaxID=7092 RepID=A0A6J2KEW1_BOMMA|nr:cytochrome c oxidase assembly protein COX16 homolog, mitochondrial [Bombyx mandarina]XP_028040129.1 cytochrome c oxidase assembly protein COX16 homolog, mitochondrial [Bombyx mandarina]